jgi:DNA-binding IclR family transcriptional regulator
MPIALGVGSRIAGSHKSKAQSPTINYAEKELLEVLERYGELTPLAAATKTSLPVPEAGQMLSELAQKGYLEVRVNSGRLSYVLWERGAQEQQSSN